MQGNPAQRPCPYGSEQYRWRYGDTLEGVAAAHETTIQAITYLNPDLDFTRVFPGTQICMPPHTLRCPNGVLYTAQIGDSFTSIARQHGIPVQALIDQNPYTDPSLLRAGQILCIPGNAETVPPLTCPPGYVTGVANFGQALADILVRHNISYEAFKAANPALNPELLLPGQRYCIPPEGQRGICENGGQSYAIEPGETFQSLSERFGIARGTLLRLNPGLAPGNFAPGRVICIGG